MAVGIQGDLGAVVEQLTAALSAGSGESKTAWVDQLRQDRNAWDEELRGKATGEAAHASPGRLHRP